MLEINVVLDEEYDEKTQCFVDGKTQLVRLEHSLVTVSKWESVWEEVFLGKKEKTQEQILSYIKIMLLEEIPPEVFRKLIEHHSDDIQKYITAEMSATKVYTDPNAPESREPVTSELIYYWMISMKIPVQFENWHLNRLLTLIRVINLKNSPKKKMTAQERRQLNRARLAAENGK